MPQRQRARLAASKRGPSRAPPGYPPTWTMISHGSVDSFDHHWLFNLNEIFFYLSPICFDLIDIAHVTKCGHSFCQTCIQTALEHTHRCPKCNTPCNINKDVFPNFTRNFKTVFYIDRLNWTGEIVLSKPNHRKSQRRLQLEKVQSISSSKDTFWLMVADE